MKTVSKKSLSVFLVIALLLSILLYEAPPLSGNALLISDCTSGWQYSGNSAIDYSVSGTDGRALKVGGSYGVMRKLSYQCDFDLSSFGAITFDFKASDLDNNDILPQALSAYGDTTHVTVLDGEESFDYPRTALQITGMGNGWYQVYVPLQCGDRRPTNMTEFQFEILRGVGFDTSLPQATFVLDSLQAALPEPLSVRLVGAQTAGNTKIRFKAALDRAEMDAFQSTHTKISYGFIYADAERYADLALTLDGPLNYRTTLSEKLYLDPDNAQNYLLAGMFTKNDFSDIKKVAIRAFVYGTRSDTGVGEWIYSYDDSYCGGYCFDVSTLFVATAAKETEVSLKGLNQIPDTTVAENPAKDTGIHPAGKPYTVPVKYDTGDGLCVAIFDAVRDFKAPVNRNSNASPSIQRALNAAKTAGGGTVYLPEGVYRCDQVLSIPSSVTLRGEWVSPETKPAAGCGTVLVVNTGNYEECIDSFISLKTGGGFCNMTVIYPSVTAGDFAPYSATIAQTPAGGSDSYTVRNVTILGATVGFDAATAWSELHYLKNVYISAIGQAIRINNVTDIGRLENVSVSPRYLLKNALMPVTAEKAKEISDYIRQNADGLYIQRSDWEYVYGLKIDGVNRGMAFESYIDASDNDRVRGSNGQMLGVEITNCNTAVDVTYTNAIGYVLTDMVIRDCDVGMEFSPAFISAFNITRLRVEGKCGAPLVLRSTKDGKVTVTDSVFNCRVASGYAVNVVSGGLSLQQCTFTQPDHHIRMENTAGAVSVLGCTFPSVADISRPSGKQSKFKFDDHPLSLPSADYHHTYRNAIPTAAKTTVFDVTDFGAVAGHDCTDAFRAALQAAEKNGGGIVYVPGGEYTVNSPLTVPTGVELRGIYDVPTHPVSAGSVIRTTVGKNDENGTPFITLQKKSGVNGISFYYPEQSFTDFIPYSWTVQSADTDCWAINAVFINSYNALDFGTYPSDNHYIQYVSGSPLRRGIFVGNNSGNGWVENVQFNPHYWKRALISDMDLTDQALLNNVVNTVSEAMIFGDNASEHVLGTFAYGAKDVLVFRSQNGKGTNGIFIGHGSDGCQNALVADQLDCVVMLNSELVSMIGEEDVHHIVMKDTVTGTLAQFNMVAWSHPKDCSIVVSGGKLLVSQLFYYNLEQTDYIARVGDATMCLYSAMLPERPTHFILANSGRLSLVGNLIRTKSSHIAPSNYRLSFAEEVRERVMEKFGWWI